MGSGKMEKDVWHREALTLALRNAILLRRWGMRVTVYDDPTPANNGDWVLSYNLVSTVKSDNANWLKVADIGVTWGGGGSSVDFGDPTEIPFINAGGTNFDYSPSITWNQATHRLVAADNVTFTGTSSWSAIFGEAHSIGGIFNDGIIAGESHIVEGISGNNAIFGRNNTLAGDGTKIFNLISGDLNVIAANAGEVASYNFVSGNGNTIIGNVSNTAIVGGNGIVATESDTLYTMSFSFDGKITGNNTGSSLITIQPGADLTVSDVTATGYFSVSDGVAQIGNSTNLLTFTEGSATTFGSPGGSGINYLGDYRANYTDRSLADWGNVLSAKTYTGKQTMFAAGTNAGLNIGLVAADPSGAANGDVWYQSTTHEIRARVNGSNVSLFPAIANTSAANEIPYTVSTYSFAASKVFRQTSGAITGLVFGSPTDNSVKVLSTNAQNSGDDLILAPKGFSTGLGNVIAGPATGNYPRTIIGYNQIYNQHTVTSDFTISNINVTTGGTSGNLVLRSQTVASSQPGNVNIIAGSAITTGNFNGGSINLTAGNKIGTGVAGNITFTASTGGYIMMVGLPTSSAGLPTGALWNNAGVLSIAP